VATVVTVIKFLSVVFSFESRETLVGVQSLVGSPPWGSLLLHWTAVSACAAVLVALLWARWRQGVRNEVRGRKLSRRSLSLLAGLLLCAAGFLVAAQTLPLFVVRTDAVLHSVVAAVLLAGAALLLRLVIRAPNVPAAARLERFIEQLEHEVDIRRTAEGSLHEAQDTLRQLAAHQEQIREEERKRIAREIHDDLGQNLMALRLDVNMLQNRTGTRHRILARRVDMALGNIDATIRSVRSIMNHLRPPVLDIGLVAAAEWQVAEFRRSTGVACEFEAEQCDDGLSDTQATAVFRILQDALHHVRRHSQITRVHIALFAREGLLHLDMRDNGVGIYPNNRRRASTLALLGMAERAHSLGGELVIEEIEGRGSELRLVIPIDIHRPNLEPAAIDQHADRVGSATAH
jgi:signal transduction histidine kinase